MSRIPFAFVLIFILSLLSGCTLPFGPTPTPTANDLIIPTTVPTNTPPPTVTLPPPAIASPPPTASLVPPTVTPLANSPNVTAIPDQETFKVRFPAGRTGVRINSTLQAGSTQRYLIRAQADQTLLAEILTPRQDLVLALYTEAGALLPPLQEGLALYEWRLPANQEFRLDVIGSSSAADYLLVINIPRIVRFPMGSYGTVERGQVGGGESFTYRLRAAQGQTMTLRLKNSQGAAVLGVYGLETGNQILAPEEGKTEWSGVLPASTHYIVQVVGVAEGVSSFEVEFDIR